MHILEMLILTILAAMSLLGVYLNIYDRYTALFVFTSISVGAYLTARWLKKNIQ
ncbi:hypothetical protein [uncultured Microscilla sp.]|uniref:hypothetical protein n=1 Tax=uncultured Microscilla sp. TaxID=432653 RepID=UPI00262D5660|nr:hypothetical protein [uncultured Microscilla sp.]